MALVESEAGIQVTSVYSASDITSNMICARDTGKDSCHLILASDWSRQIT